VSSDVFALLLGTALAVGALAYVLHPLFFATHVRRDVAAGTRVPEDTAVSALREIEFDRATGKLSDADYAELRRTYAERAVLELRESERVVPDETIDPVEARIRSYRRSHRECPDCGLRPEPNAVYCSTCGAFLDRRCRDCGSEIREPGAVFCSTCGGRLVRRLPTTNA
jgi:hypothetical protein